MDHQREQLLRFISDQRLIMRPESYNSFQEAWFIPLYGFLCTHHLNVMWSRTRPSKRINLLCVLSDSHYRVLKTWLHVQHTMKLATKTTTLNLKTLLTWVESVTWMLENCETVGIKGARTPQPKHSSAGCRMYRSFLLAPEQTMGTPHPFQMHSQRLHQSCHVCASAFIICLKLLLPASSPPSPLEVLQVTAALQEK